MVMFGPMRMMGMLFWRGVLDERRQREYACCGLIIVPMEMTQSVSGRS